MSGDSSLGIGIGLALKSYGRGFRGLLNQYPGAAAAYSLRKLSSSTSNVVRVRRSFDDFEQDFTAAEVSGGTLVNFANNGTSALYGNKMYFDGVDDRVTLSSNIDLGTADFTLSATVLLHQTANNSGLFSTGGGGRYFAISADGTTLRVRAEGEGNRALTIAGGFPFDEVVSISIIKSSDILTFTINGVTVGTLSNVLSSQYIIRFIGDEFGFARLEGTIYDVNINGVAAYQGYGNTNADWEDQIGSNDGTVTGSPALYSGQGFDGFVAKWYDQSGNGNDAVQATTTAQPKIVDGGSLVAGGIDFDGVNHYLKTDVELIQTDDVLSLYNVSIIDDVSTRGRIVGDSYYNASNDNAGFLFEVKAAAIPTGIAAYFDDVVQNQIGLNSVTEASESLFSLTLDGGISRFYINGNLEESRSSTSMKSTVGEGGGGFVIGATPQGALPFDGKINEIIVYNSDTSGNRTAIEGNINAHYNIYP